MFLSLPASTDNYLVFLSLLLSPQLLQEQKQANGHPPQVINLLGVMNITPEHVVGICEVILHNANLRVLELPGVDLRDRHLENLTQALIFRRTCERLNIAGSFSTLSVD